MQEAAWGCSDLLSFPSSEMLTRVCEALELTPAQSDEEHASCAVLMVSRPAAQSRVSLNSVATSFIIFPLSSSSYGVYMKPVLSK